MPPTATLDALDYLTLDAIATKAVDPEKGIVEALVAVTNNVDDGRDRILPGAFAFDRHPKIVWAHDLKVLVAKVLDYAELLPGDSRLPDDLKTAGYGALWFQCQFDLEDPDSLKAYRKVVFHEDLGWSIGYRAEGAKKRKDGGRDLPKVIVYEASPLTFGMNREARTLSVKSLLADAAALLPAEEAKIAEGLLGSMTPTETEEVPTMTTNETPETEADEKKTWPPMPGSMEALREAARLAVAEWAVGMFGERTEENEWYCYVEATFGDSVVFTVETGDGERNSFRVPYALEDDGTVTLGDPVAVEIETSVAVVDASTEKAGDLDLADVALDDETLAAVESIAEIAEEAKAGRVLSKTNREKVAAAVDALAAVLAAAEKDEKADDEEEKAAVLDPVFALDLGLALS